MNAVKLEVSALEKHAANAPRRLVGVLMKVRVYIAFWYDMDLV